MLCSSGGGARRTAFNSLSFLSESGAERYLHTVFRAQDFVLCAYVRIVGPERFRIANSAVSVMVRLGLAGLTDAERADLLAQARAMR